ncbi:MAG: hypothetical protein OHK0046_11170 [Anaerolineae bacterium]
MKKLSLLFICLWLAACGGNNDTNLPTVFQMSLDGSGTPIITLTPAAQNVEITPIPVSATPILNSAATLPPSWTPTPEATLTTTLTVTASMTITDTPTRTPSATATETLEARALDSFLAVQQSATVPPTSPALLTQIASGGVFNTGTPQAAVIIPGGGAQPTLPVQCQYTPPGGFDAALRSDPTLVTQIGCPVGTPPNATAFASATQRFQNGAMIWVGSVPSSIYVLYNTGNYQRFEDTYNAGVDPESGNQQPPQPNLIEPVRGFGKVWRDNNLSSTLGWATEGEVPTTTTALDFARGRMLSLPTRSEIVILIEPQGTWRAVTGQF